MKKFLKSIPGGTNNLAELLAVEQGLLTAKEFGPTDSLEVTLYSDSTYAIGVLTKQHTPKKYLDIISSIQNLMGSFLKVEIVKMKAHSKHYYSDYVDQVAKKASSILLLEV